MISADFISFRIIIIIIGIQISLNLFDVLLYTSLTKQKMILLFRNFYYAQNVMIETAVF